MPMPSNFSIAKKRIAGALLIALGVLALTTPLVVGRWSLAILALPLIAMGFTEAYVAFTSPRGTEASAYLPSALPFLAGIVLLLSSALVPHGLLTLLIAILTVDGFGKIIAAWRRPRPDRLPLVLNGLVDFGCAAAIWYLGRFIGSAQAIGVIVGAYIVATGWRLLMAPVEAAAADTAATGLNLHPDPGLGVPGNERFAHLRSEADSGSQFVRAADLLWMSTLGIVFLAIHAGRMPLTDDLLGRISPFVATVGDVLMALVFAIALMLPARLAWRRVTRPVERLAWTLRFNAEKEKEAARMNRVADWLMRRWLAARFDFSLRLREARLSLPFALILLLRLGLPVTAFFVAVNPIWGFSWYFNTESWATGIYQKLTELRVDPWRADMIEAVSRAYGGGDELFRIEPQGVAGNGDFSFLVIGDPGEGDASQFSLASRYLKLGQSDDVKFLVVSSDVIYPAGAIEDYEAKFYLPFQGFAKPVYAIPGNHDWFDALESFNANFLEPKAARSAIEARVDADLGLTGTNARRIDNLMAQAARLRRLYGVNVGAQRAPYFELQTDDFALLAIDTGILRTVDERQLAWIERALDRSRGKFIMAIVGHPRFAGGHDIPPASQGQDVSESSAKFAALYRLLATRNVNIAMAGDTHDFEYYKQNIAGDGPARLMHHFVNGGGGAYLSIGTALDFPKEPGAADWAFYPRTDHLRAKMDAEMPLWKQPFWYWIKWFNAWPFSVEAFSGIFDFNRAPFFQSFMEVRVERSKKRIVLVLNGVHGPLQWRDLQTGGAVIPSGARLDDPVEFIVPMDRQ
jgi:uncharacterized membrane protein HdeD (DUF308 family)